MVSYGRILLDTFSETPIGTTVNMRIDPSIRELFARFPDGTEKQLTGGTAGLIGADNGTQQFTPGIVSLGGSLIRNTPIVGNGFDLKFTNTRLSIIGQDNSQAVYPSGAKRYFGWIGSLGTLLAGDATGSEWDSIPLFSAVFGRNNRSTTSGLDSLLYGNNNSPSITDGSLVGGSNNTGGSLQNTYLSGKFLNLVGSSIENSLIGASFSTISGIVFESIISGNSNTIVNIVSSIVSGSSNYIDFVSHSGIFGGNNKLFGSQGTIIAGESNDDEKSDYNIIAGRFNQKNSTYGGPEFGNFWSSLIIGENNRAYIDGLSDPQYSGDGLGCSVLAGHSNTIKINPIVKDTVFSPSGNDPVPICNIIGGSVNQLQNVFNSVIGGFSQNVLGDILDPLSDNYSSSNILVSQNTIFFGSTRIISLGSITSSGVSSTGLIDIGNSSAQVDNSTSSGFIGCNGVGFAPGSHIKMSLGSFSVGIGLGSLQALTYLGVSGINALPFSIYYENLRSVLPGGGLGLISPDGLVQRTLTIDNSGFLPSNVIPSLGGIYQLISQKDLANGYAGLDVTGKINPSQLPPIAITDTFVVASQAAMLALVAQTGDIAVRTDLSQTFILTVNDPTVLANWTVLLSPTSPVSSVFGRTGAVTAQANDYTFAQIGSKPTTIAGYGITDGVTITGSQVLTNKTLTTPVINVGSDATGDLYYRNEGVFTRIPIGTVGHVLTQVGGIPTWAAPSGSAGVLKSSSSISLGNIIAGTGSTNTVHYIRFVAPADITVANMSAFITSASGTDSITVGIYNTANARLTSASFVPSVVGFTSVAVAPVALTGGTVYWLALKGTNGSSNFGHSTVLALGSLCLSEFSGPAGLPATKAGTAATVAPFIGISV